ncbi:MAG: 1-deoxy-D-xylulose-5-phosphate reductoisomerase, partial [Clostridia bacterium]|nr:1-deoxy-D-xylulose-5-phosphate reductoisomerase [Clostridia bacterium]
MKKVGIIGSTGSIGTQALQVIRELNGEEPESFSVSVLACGGNVGLLARQAAEFLPEAVSVGDKNGAEQFRELIGELRPGYKPEVFYGAQGLKKAAAFDQDILLNSVVGMVGIEPTLAAVKKGTDIALANQETLVAAGDIVMREAKKSGSRILPVDSEHSAVFQCL